MNACALPRRVLLSLVILWVGVACKPRPEPTVAQVVTTTRAPSHGATATTDDQIIAQVTRAVVRHHLLTVPLKTVQFDLTPGQPAHFCYVTARVDAGSNFVHRLFSVRYDRQTGEMATDAYSLSTGDFRPLR